MRNYKTSITGVLTAAVALATYFKWIPETAGVLIVTLGLAVFALFAKDNDVSGT